MDENKLGIEDYELETWITQLGSVPVERTHHENLSPSYEMCMAHVFKLENGQYALVTEHGCSCYTPDSANIDLFPTLKAAEKNFNEWVKANKREDY
jgi:hypothetical protein